MSTHSDRAMTLRIEQLEAENAELRERNAYLVEALTPSLKLPFGLRLSPSQDKVLRTLLAHEYAPASMILAALDWHDNEPRSERAPQVHVCKLRKRLEPYGVEIKTRYTIGYYIEPEGKAILARMGCRP